MRIAFCGTPDFGVPALRQLLTESGLSVVAVVTQPDRPRGRGQSVSASPVKQVASDASVPVFQPERIKSDEAYEFFVRLAPDAVVIIAYGQIVPARLIAIPRLGWINLHASLLPKYRGAAPIAWAIANGETTTGLTTMQIDAGMDTGPTLLQHELKIGDAETAPDVSQRMAKAGAPLIVQSLRQLDRGEIAPKPQDSSQATYAPLLKKEHGRIDWQLPARQIHNRMRGFAPWPGAFSVFRDHVCHLWGRPAESALAADTQQPGTIIAVGAAIYVVCGEGSCLELKGAQLEGRKRVTPREFANGARLTPGERFGGASA